MSCLSVTKPAEDMRVQEPLVNHAPSQRSVRRRASPRQDQNVGIRRLLRADPSASRAPDAYRTAHADQLARLEKELPELEGGDSPFAHLVRYGLLYERAVLSWLDSLPWRGSA